MNSIPGSPIAQPAQAAVHVPPLQAPGAPTGGVNLAAPHYGPEPTLANMPAAPGTGVAGPRAGQRATINGDQSITRRRLF